MELYHELESTPQRENWGDVQFFTECVILLMH